VPSRFSFDTNLTLSVNASLELVCFIKSNVYFVM